MVLRTKITFTFYFIICISMYAILIYGLHLIIRQLFREPFEASLVFLTPVTVVTLPIMILGVLMGFQRYHHQEEDITKENGLRISDLKKQIAFSTVSTLIAAITSLYSLGYFYTRDDVIRGSILAIIAVTASVVHLPAMKKVLNIMLGHFDQIRARRD